MTRSLACSWKPEKIIIENKYLFAKGELLTTTTTQIIGKKENLFKKKPLGHSLLYIECMALHKSIFVMEFFVVVLLFCFVKKLIALFVKMSCKMLTSCVRAAFNTDAFLGSIILMVVVDWCSYRIYIYLLFGSDHKRLVGWLVHILEATKTQWLKDVIIVYENY